MMSFQSARAACPLVAILRGVSPREVVDVVGVLLDAGFSMIEIPLNSPDPLVSIQRAQDAFGDRAILGAGTVLTAEAVAAVHQTGARLIVAPNFDPQVAAACRDQDMIYGPGVATMSEAFAALHAGADFLKLFPAELIPPKGVKAMRAVLPTDCPVFPVGGIGADAVQMAGYFTAGADGFGLGSGLYAPGRDLADIAKRAHSYVAALRTAQT